MEVALDNRGLPLRAAEIRAYTIDHLGPRGRALAAQGVAFDVLVEELVGVQVRAVPGQEEQLQARGVPGQPAFDRGRESSELEYGADTAYVLVPGRNDPETVTLRCLKHRYGEPVDVNLRFERRIQSFRPIGPGPATPADRGRLMASLQALWNSTSAAADDGGGDQ